MQVSRHGEVYGQQARRSCSDTEVWRYGTLETRCRRRDVEVWSLEARLQAQRRKT